MGDTGRCGVCDGPLAVSGDGGSFCPACLLREGLAETGDHASVPAPEAPEPAPDSIAGYRILGRLGEGGMGVVYLAEETGPLRRRVAIKRIKIGADSGQIVARFRMEQQSLALMDHPAIARIHDAGTTPDGHPYFVMEYVDGPTITEYCDLRQSTTEERIRLFLDVCHAIQHAHQRGVIHRDLKPSNILVAEGEDGPQVKVIDFGVAKATARRFLEWSVFTEIGRLIGTPVYMSPEQADGSDREVDTRTDVYSLGVVLYELLVGATPIDEVALRGIGLQAILATVQRASFPTPSSRIDSLGDRAVHSAETRATTPPALSRRLRGDLDWIVMRALDRDRDRRFRSPADLADDLRRHLDGEPVESGPPGAVYRLRKTIRRHRIAFTMAVTMFAGLIVAVAGVSVGLVRAQRAEAEARLQAEIAEATHEFLNQDLLESVAPEIVGRDVRVLDVIDRAGEQIDARFADAPRIRASIHRSVGRAYTHLGRYDQAEPHLREALDLRRSELGEEHLDTAVSLAELAALLGLSGRAEEGADLAEEAVGRMESAGAPVETVLHYRREAAVIAGWAGRNDEVLGRYREMLPVARRELGEGHETTIHILNDLALLHAARNEMDLAIPMIEEAIRLQNERSGPDHAFTLVFESNRALIHGQQRDFATAARLYGELRPRFERVFGANHPRTLTILGSEAVAINRLGRGEEAAAIQRELLERKAEALGPRHPSTLSSHYSLGRTLLELDEVEEAARNFRLALDGRREALGEDARATIRTESLLAVAETRLGRIDTALAHHASVLARTDRFPDTLGHVVAAFHARHGDTLAAAGRTDDAIAAWREAVRIYDLRPDERQEARDAVAAKLREALGADATGEDR